VSGWLLCTGWAICWNRRVFTGKKSQSSFI